jgi:hypothetical protein
VSEELDVVCGVSGQVDVVLETKKITISLANHIP